ncbi:MAG: hypothetical protein ABIP65_07445 [Vicinamibacterales bacterium]
MTKKDTSEYSSTKAPETRPAAEERDGNHASTLIPGGALGSPSPQGMAALEREEHATGVEQEPDLPLEKTLP